MPEKQVKGAYRNYTVRAWVQVIAGLETRYSYLATSGT